MTFLDGFEIIMTSFILKQLTITINAIDAIYFVFSFKISIAIAIAMSVIAFVIFFIWPIATLLSIAI